SRFKHVAGDARILANQNLATPLLGKHLARGPPQLEHEIRRDRVLTHPATDAIRAKESFAVRHSLFSSQRPRRAEQTFSASAVSATSWVRTILAPFITATTCAATPAATRSFASFPVRAPSMRLRDM